VINQSLDYSCGPASLATLLTYYFGDKITEDQIIKSLLMTTDLQKVKAKKGFSLLDLKNFAQLKGYEVVGYKMDLEYLVNLDQPVLIPMKIKDYSHFVIFRGQKGDRVFLADPALGNLTMRVERFLNLWRDGIGLVLSKANTKGVNPVLKLSDEEKAVFADPALVRQIFGMDSIGKVYADGEF
jgi:predicted double-glycine peptidase